VAAGRPDSVRLVTIGRKGLAHITRRGWTAAFSYTEMGDVPDTMRVRRMTEEITRLFTGGEVDQVRLLFTRFLSTMSRRVVVETFLPIEGGAAETGGGARDYIFEPSPGAIFGTLLPRYAVTRLLAALAESLASEHSSRMIAMGAATQNAEDMIHQLVIRRNRTRQTAITKEIAELVGGAEALK
jgi:F-type H+-transporting ATPase subunit gamma